MSSWFTSDPHFNHKNIIRYCKRPFADVIEMNKALIANWNSVVQPNDTVYLLGDFALGSLGDSWLARKALNGTIHMIWGNHDKNARKMNGAWATEQSYLELELPGYPMIVLSHYAHRIWIKAHHGTFHLYGHSHGTLPDDPNALSFDVGVDCHDYRPIHIDEVCAIMSKKRFKPVDHHTGDMD